MTIRFLGHSSFLITTGAGTRILTDPFDPADYGDEFNYAAFTGPVEVVTISHDHRDHSGYRKIKGSPVIIKGQGTFGAEDAEFLGVATCHDAAQGAQRGANTVFVISADGLRIAHMGDLGHVLTADQAAEIGNVDVALIPVGGYYTIDAEQAGRVAEQVDANIVIPMHYLTDKCSFPIAGVEEFVRGKANVSRPGRSLLKVTKESLPSERQIVVLKHEL
jgi:L-ascorbate metabolism protein UlaG (beta-lactamase superfamily)